MNIKIIPLFILLITITSAVFAQQSDWVYVGNTQKYEVYYLNNSIIRGTYTYVTVAGKFRQKQTDPDGKEYKYATAMLAYYNSTYGDIRCILMDKRYYYTDNDYRKSGEPKIEYIVGSVKVLNDIYNKIK